MTRTGLDVLIGEGFARLRGKRVGLLCHRASISSGLDHIIDLLFEEHRSGRLQVAALFGPQHGITCHTQDNMIEWEGGIDARTGVRTYSLYGEVREPTEAMLSECDLLVIDLQDVGARYYTFIWTLALCLKACEQAGLPALVLDRPNPIGGLQVEGPVLDPAFASFVGLHPLPVRHGLTIGEVAIHLRDRYYPRCDVQIVPMQGWRREFYYEQTELPWAMPSPNMPTIDTAVVYPGMCLFEATNLSEGRGTTRPFEMFGAPFLDGHRLSDSLNRLSLPGVRFRHDLFQPTFNKHSGDLCEGCFIHVLERRKFEPVLTALAALQECKRQAGPAFEWKAPPYEYEFVKRPIDILCGNAWLSEAIDSFVPLPIIRSRLLEETESFMREEAPSLIYP